MENADNTEFHGGNVRSDRELQYDELMRVTGHPKDLVSFVSKLMPMNTNDGQAPYTVKLNGPVEAAPMLSDRDILQMSPDMDVSELSWWQDGAKAVRDWFQAKIASGELMVVPKDTAGRCLKCNTRVAEQHNSRKWHFPKFCPNCGKESPEAKA